MTHLLKLFRKGISGSKIQILRFFFIFISFRFCVSFYIVGNVVLKLKYQNVHDNDDTNYTMIVFSFVENVIKNKQ